MYPIELYTSAFHPSFLIQSYCSSATNVYAKITSMSSFFLRMLQRVFYANVVQFFLTFTLKVRIKRFVYHSDLFHLVEDKDRVVEVLTRVCLRADFNDKLNSLTSCLHTFPMCWNHPIFNDRDILHLVVIAHILKRIPDCVLGTIFTRWATINHYQKPCVKNLFPRGTILMNTVSLFLENKEINPKARELIEQNFNPTSNLSGTPRLSKECIDLWYSYMLLSPPPEQSFTLRLICGNGFEALHHYKKIKKTSEKETYQLLANLFRNHPLHQPQVLDAAYHCARSNLFYRVRIGNGYALMGPSFSMVFNLFKVLIKEDPKYYTICFGMGKKPWLNKKRIISLYSPYAPLPDRADSYVAYAPQITDHDLIYHMYRIIHIPRSHQKLFFGWATALKQAKRIMEQDPKYVNQHPTFSDVIQPTIEAIEDMEFDNYLPVAMEHMQKLGLLRKARDPLSLCFWLALNNAVKIANSRTFMQSILAYDSRKNKKSYTYYDYSFPSPLCEASIFALKLLFVHHTSLADEANVSLNDLRPVGLALKLEVIAAKNDPAVYKQPITILSEQWNKISS